MKVWLAGAFCSGKTTLAKNFSRHIVDVEREAMLGKNINNMTKQELVLYQKRLVERQWEKEQLMWEDFVTDNPLYVPLVYSRNVDQDVGRRTSEYLIDKAKYDLIFLCEPLEVVDDGMRHIDYDFQRKIHDDVVKVLEEFGVRYIHLVGDVQNRITKILECLEEETLKS